MAGSRTTHSLSVRSYELRPDRRAGNTAFLNWFQEAAIASSTAMGYDPERYRTRGLAWIMHESDLEVIERPGFNEQIEVATWVAGARRVVSCRQYEARRSDGTLLARCSTQWVMVDLETQRPRRIPRDILEAFEPTEGFTLEPLVQPTGSAGCHEQRHRVPFYEEDELGHVNHANYLNWIEENARLAAREAGRNVPGFRRHRLEFRLPAFKDDRLVVRSTFAPGAAGTLWEHDILRGEAPVVKGYSLEG